MNNKNLGIYIHIPFCVKKCNYCDFNSGSFSEEIRNKYIDALCEEIKFRSVCFSDRKIDTVFMGGGTPSILIPEQTGRIFDCLRSFYDISDDAEISIESNPGTLDKDKLKAYKTLGINRLSMGLQSFNDNELKALGRIHNERDFLESFSNAREAGFDNINVDLMSAIPHQTLSSFESNLLKLKKLSPEHVSIYSLIIEENTPFYDMKLDLPGEEDERQMVHMIPEILTDYCQYEISNYSKKGYECKHNIKYWKRDEYLGFGISSASLIKDEYRFKNISDINNYIDFYLNEKKNDSLTDRFYLNNSDIFEEYEILKNEDKISEYIILGLRMNEGISLENFENIFGKSIFDIYESVINKHKKEGLLSIEDGKLKLSDKGRDLANYVWSDFI